jgi:hypothetical protein
MLMLEIGELAPKCWQYVDILIEHSRLRLVSVTTQRHSHFTSHGTHVEPLLGDLASHAACVLPPHALCPQRNSTEDTCPAHPPCALLGITTLIPRARPPTHVTRWTDGRATHSATSLFTALLLARALVQGSTAAAATAPCSPQTRGADRHQRCC